MPPSLRAVCDSNEEEMVDRAQAYATLSAEMVMYTLGR